MAGAGSVPEGGGYAACRDMGVRPAFRESIWIARECFGQGSGIVGAALCAAGLSGRQRQQCLPQIQQCLPQITDVVRRCRII